ncbi:MAG TPA: dipeptidase [Chitinophagaceae bacterium]
MMKGAWLICLLACGMLTAFSQPSRKFHNKSILVDTHNDVLTTAVEDGLPIDSNLKGKTHSDIQRFLEGGVDIQIFSVWCDGTYGNGRAFERANREIDTLYAVAARNQSRMMMVFKPADLREAVRKKKLGAMIGVEGGHMIEDRLDYLDSLYKRGTRYLTLTWNNSTSWATSAMDESAAQSDSANTNASRQKGLSPFGQQVIKRMNELGMIVDVSHVGEQTFRDAIRLTSKPVIASHSCAHKLCPVFRNLKDDQIRAIAKNGGVIHLNFFSGFVDSNFNKRNTDFIERHKAERDSLLKLNPEPYFADSKLFEKYADEVKSLRPPLSALLDHLDHIVKIAGTDHVGLGSDFDGINSSPQQLDDVTAFPLITDELLKRGYSKKDVRKILGGNFIRVFEANAK